MSFVCRPHKILLLWLISVMILFLIGAAPVFAGDPFGFSSSWNYQKNGGDTGAGSQFNESYNLTYSKELSAAMTFSGSVRYSQNHPSEGDDSNSLNPNLSLDLRNDLFALNLNASESTSGRDGAPTRTDDSWGLNLNSQVDGWPSLRLYFNQSTATDDGTPKQSDSDVMTVGAGTEYSFEHVDLLYDLRHSQSSDHVQNSNNETLDQTAQVSYDQNFMQGRISVSASQQFQMTENNTETRVGVGNIYFVDVNAVTGFYAVDNSPTLGFLATQPDLVDGDLVSPTVIDIFASTDMQNMGVQVNFQTTTRLEVFLDQQLTLTQQSLLSWQAYRSDDGNNWTLLGGAVTYPLENSRTVVTIDLPTPLTARYVKVVSDATLASATPVFVTELQASEERVATTDVVSLSRESKSLQTQFNTSVRLTDHWSISYSLRRAETRQDIGDTVQFNHSLTSSYNPSEKLGFAAGVSENSDEADNSPGRRNRSYSISMSMLPLPTLSISLGYTRSENQSDDGQDTLSDSISSALNATIYPDLTASLAVNWSQSKDLAEGTASNSYGLTLNTTAYLTPQVDMNTNLGYTESVSNSGETGRATSYGFTLGYRPSDMLLLNFSYDGELEEGRSVFSGSSNWLWSKKLQSQFGFSFDFGDDPSQQYNTLLSWLISRSLSLQSSGNYLTAEKGDSWAMNATVNMVF